MSFRERLVISSGQSTSRGRQIKPATNVHRTGLTCGEAKERGRLRRSHDSGLLRGTMPRMMSNTTSSRHRAPPLFCIPEDGCSDDGGIGPVAWIAILRDGCLLVDIGEERVPDEVREVAGFLTSLVHTPMVGWNEYTTRGAAAQWKGLRYSEETAERSWTFTCVYNMQKLSPTDAKAFLQEIVDWTATLRQVDEAWLNGSHHACQSLFAPLLQDRLQRLANAIPEPIKMLEGEEEQESEEKPQGDDENDLPFPSNRKLATKGPVPPLSPPKLRNVTHEKPASGCKMKPAKASQQPPPLPKSSEIQVGDSTSLEEKNSSCDISLESCEVLHVSAEMDDLWDTTLADISHEKKGSRGITPSAWSIPATRKVARPTSTDSSASPKKPSMLPTSPSNPRSPSRTTKSSPSTKSPTRKPVSPGSRRSPRRRKETVQEMVERLARKQAEMEKARLGVASVEEKAKTTKEVVHGKPSDDSESSTTSATVEEDDESDGGSDAVEPKTNPEDKTSKSNCCWMSTPLSQSKPGLLL